MRRLAFATLSGILVALALLAIRAPSERGPLMRDFEAYYAAGSAYDAGGDAYARTLFQYERNVPGVDATSNDLLPFVGAPPTLPFWGAFARLDYATAIDVWRAVLVLSLGALVFASIRLAGARANALDVAVASLCALSFVPITSDFGLGQTALVACAGAALTVLCARTSAIASGIFAIVGALQPNVAIAAIVAATKRRGLIALAGAVIVLFLLGARVSGFGWPLHYSALLREHAAAERFTAIQYSPQAIAHGFGLGATLSTSIGWALGALALAIAVAGVVRTKNLSARFAIACAALPLVSGFVHEHDLVLLFFPALWATRNARKGAVPVAILGFALAAVNWMDFAQQPKALAQDVVLALGSLAAILAWVDARRFPAYGAAMVAIACIAAGAWLGAHHPAPLWPNDMHPFTAAAGASSAAIWNLEQRSTGLERVEPAWALLRSFSLAGSMMLLAVAAFGLNVDVHEVVERRDRVGIEVL